ncbi:hypothetical protein [Paenibacillus sp. OAS669]|uniref:hypothetical protein n=1 Tax=Paenibacillus sp. OAS669 TaxID=2663821 RepID=UPI00178B2AB0|nr:hypothetical protein [Paenibacillus sp. OAS669]MBE1444197.1 hypothetical protein [Paenibacillus sp. OAS669]
MNDCDSSPFTRFRIKSRPAAFLAEVASSPIVYRENTDELPKGETAVPVQSMEF